MGDWQVTINIKPILQIVEAEDYPTPEQVEKVGKDVAELIRSSLPSLPARIRRDWAKIADEVEESAEAQDVEELDYMLNEMYDLADATKVWLGA